MAIVSSDDGERFVVWVTNVDPFRLTARSVPAVGPCEAKQWNHVVPPYETVPAVTAEDAAPAAVETERIVLAAATSIS